MSAVVVLSLSQAELEELVKRAVLEAFILKPSGNTNDSKLPRRLFTVPQACREFSIGRAALMDMVKSGKLRTSMRKMRGGREGHMLRVEDLERVLSGVR